MIPGDPLAMRNLDGTMSSVLQNNFNITDETKMAKAEGLFIPPRLNQVAARHNRGEFEGMSLSDRMSEIHRSIFSDIYPWAGEFRMINVSKRRTDTNEITRFDYIEALGTDPSKLTPNAISSGAKEIKAKIDEVGRWAESQDLSDPKVLAAFVSKLNVLHPFREGNGRVVREMTRQVLAEKGLLFKFTASMKDAWNHASADAAAGRQSNLIGVLAKTMHPDPPGSMLKPMTPHTNTLVNAMGSARPS